MALPTPADAKTLKFVRDGMPFVSLAAKAGIDTKGLSYVRDGRPFVAIPASGAASGQFVFSMAISTQKQNGDVLAPAISTQLDGRAVGTLAISTQAQGSASFSPAITTQTPTTQTIFNPAIATQAQGLAVFNPAITTQMPTEQAVFDLAISTQAQGSNAITNAISTQTVSGTSVFNVPISTQASASTVFAPAITTEGEAELYDFSYVVADYIRRKISEYPFFANSPRKWKIEFPITADYRLFSPRWYEVLDVIGIPYIGISNGFSRQVGGGNETYRGNCNTTLTIIIGDYRSERIEQEMSRAQSAVDHLFTHTMGTGIDPNDMLPSYPACRFASSIYSNSRKDTHYNGTMNFLRHDFVIDTQVTLYNQTMPVA